MKTYIKPEIIATSVFQPVFLAASDGDLKLNNFEGDNPYDAAPSFRRAPWK